MIKHYHSNQAAMISELVNVIADDLDEALERSGQAFVALSGGSTPIPLFASLANVELAWDQVSITLTDERWVDISSEQSNERTINRHLLTGCANNAKFISLKNDHDTPEEGAGELEQILQETIPALDIVVLGMGNDGHFASLFPNAPELEAGLDLANTARCLAVRPESTSTPRMSLTLSMLLSAKKIYLLITGNEKQKVLDRAIVDARHHELFELPIAAVLNQNKVPVHIFWSEGSN